MHRQPAPGGQPVGSVRHLHRVGQGDQAAVVLDLVAVDPLGAGVEHVQELTVVAEGCVQRRAALFACGDAVIVQRRQVTVPVNGEAGNGAAARVGSVGEAAVVGDHHPTRRYPLPRLWPQRRTTGCRAG